MEKIKEFIQNNKTITIIVSALVLVLFIGGVSFGVYQSNVAKEQAAIEAQKKEEAAKKAEAKKKAEEKAKKKAEAEAKKAKEEAAKKEAEVAEAEAENTTENTKNAKNTNKNTNASNSSSQSSQAQTSSTQGATPPPTGTASFAFCSECGGLISGDPKDHWPVCPALQPTLEKEGQYGCKRWSNGTVNITDEAREAYRAQWEIESQPGQLYHGHTLDQYVCSHVFQ